MIDIYGYIIEKRYKLTHIRYLEAGMEWSEWLNDSNHKIYKSEEIANDAIKQLKKSGVFTEYQFRIIPLYVITTDEKQER